MTRQSRKPQALIAIVTQQRSGSKWVGSLIRERYGAISLGETFSPEVKSVLSFRSYLSCRSIDQIIGSDINQILDDYFDEIRTYAGLFYSFDAMFNQMDWLNFSWRRKNGALYDYLRSRNDIVVSLVRDMREIFISMKALEITGQAHYTQLDKLSDERNFSHSKFSVDLSEFIAFRETVLSDRRFLAETFNNYENYIEMRYEDLMEDAAEALRPLDNALLRFGESIGHGFPSGLSPFPKLNKSPLNYSELVVNFDEVMTWPS